MLYRRETTRLGDGGPLWLCRALPFKQFIGQPISHTVMSPEVLMNNTSSNNHGRSLWASASMLEHLLRGGKLRLKHARMQQQKENSMARTGQTSVAIALLLFAL